MEEGAATTVPARPAATRSGSWNAAPHWLGRCIPCLPRVGYPALPIERAQAARVTRRCFTIFWCRTTSIGCCNMRVLI